MELIQLTPTVAVPERTAELALHNPGVMTVLAAGVKVLSYLDRRDEIEAERQEQARKDLSVLLESNHLSDDAVDSGITDQNLGETI